jgi:hypothetical protein
MEKIISLILFLVNLFFYKNVFNLLALWFYLFIRDIIFSILIIYNKNSNIINSKGNKYIMNISNKNLKTYS